MQNSLSNIKLFAILLSTVLLLILAFIKPTVKDFYPLYIYNFGGLMELNTQDQIRMLSDMGYKGMTIQTTSDKDEVRLSDYIRLSKKEKDFKIFSAFVRYNFDDSIHEKERWKRVINQIKSTSASLWLIFGPRTLNSSDFKVDSVLNDVMRYAEKKHVKVVLYPHSKCYIESAEQALTFVKRNHSPKLKLAVHLCHEIRAGNARRIDEVVRAVEPFIGAVTICGTDSVADFRSAYAMDTTTIKSLDRGNFDVSEFLIAIQQAGYKGPIGFINFSIKEPPSGYLVRSIRKWNLLTHNNQYF